ncbi:MAG: hypothetical protein ACFB13_12085 [Kiloniellaceae bacterium]
MFELGKDYRITMIESGRSMNTWTVVAQEGTLIKLKNPHSADKILNTASLCFVSAERA